MVPCSIQVLAPAVTPLTWAEELTLLEDDGASAGSRPKCQPSSSHSDQYLETL
jgi:hypothetical protein